MAATLVLRTLAALGAAYVGARSPLGLTIGAVLSVALYVLLSFGQLRSRSASFWAALGFIAPLAPIGGPGTLMAATFVTLACGPIVLVLHPGALPWLCALGAAAIGVVVAALPTGSFSYFWGSGITLSAATDFSHWLRTAPPEWYSDGLSFFRWLIFFLLLSGASCYPRGRVFFTRGLACGVLGAVLAGVLFLLVPDLGLPTDSPFWSAIARESATFSDPNAAGITFLFAVLALFTCLGEESRRWRIFYGVVISAVLGYSPAVGSRTFYLGLVLFPLCWSWFAERRWFWRGIGAVVLGIVLVQVVPDSWIATLPGGVGRVAKSVRLEHLSEMWASRSIFWQLAWSIWRDHAMFGVGLGNFAAYVTPYATRANIALGGWVDNANNFYLGVLAEMGLLGFSILAVSGYRLFQRGKLPPLRRSFVPTMIERGLPVVPRTVPLGDEDRPVETTSSQVHPIIVSAGIVVAVSLLFGPHFDFDEVSLVAAVLLAPLVVSGRLTSEPQWFIWPIIAAIGVAAYIRPFGWYGSETLEGKVARWSEPRARTAVACLPDGSARLWVRSAAPDTIGRPRRVKAILGTGIGSTTTSVLVLGDHRWHELSLPCGVGSGTRMVTLAVTPAWQPSRFNLGTDARLLGVQVAAVDETSRQ